MVSIIRLTDGHSDELPMVGGKGANLGRLAQAGFPVPTGFVVSTDAYAAAVDDLLAGEIAEIVVGLDYDDPDALEAATANIRERIVAAPLPPDLGEEITAAYAELGDDPYVAVRSSGTAEDLAEASFAGLHDTYLDVRGAAEVLVNVRRCWASMWTARAVAYRHNKGFAHDASRLAVVVQAMVESEVAGVLFTGNPMTTATDEYVVNASYGLGEAVVSGLVTPDQFVLHAPTMTVEERVVGTKTHEIVRDRDSSTGTVTLEVAAARQSKLSLDDDQLAELGLLGRRVSQYYDGLPQDIEWGYAKGAFALLQARPVTGVEFTWDDQVDAWQPLAEDRETLWTRAWADEIWTGAVTPLFYSIRARGFTNAHMNGERLWGLDENADRRMWHYYKGGVYYNCAVDRTLLKSVIWPQLRPGLLQNVPPEWQEDILTTKFSPLAYLRMIARIQCLQPRQGLYNWLGTEEDYMANYIERANGPSAEEIHELDDTALEALLDEYIGLEMNYVTELWSGYFVHINQMMSLLGLLLVKWYDGDNPQIFTDLITGAPVRTATPEENIRLWKMSRTIYESPELRALFEKYPDAAFFTHLDDSEEGRAFAADYRAFLAEHGHRGHAERDVYYPRRLDDPALDYRALQLMLASDPSHDPEHAEEVVNERREQAIADVLDNISHKALGRLKVDVFRHVFDYVTRFLVDRDNERHWLDRSTYTLRRAAIEIGDRLVTRGLLDTPDEVFFLIREELFDLLDGHANVPLTHAKIAGRRQAWDRFARREQVPPAYVQRRRPAPYGRPQLAPSGTMQGIGTSRGTITGTARIVKELKDIGRVNSHEIMVVNSTDPGWTPVFLVISGIVLETGGILAHGSCLAREYGFPAVQLADAMSLIPDGATITINGDTGEVRVHQEDDAATEDAPVAELAASGG